MKPKKPFLVFYSIIRSISPLNSMALLYHHRQTQLFFPGQFRPFPLPVSLPLEHVFDIILHITTNTSSFFPAEDELAEPFFSRYNMDMVDYERIIRECFWDSHTSKEKIQHLLAGGNQRDKKRLFEKILLNSSRYLQDLRLFEEADLRVFLEDFHPPAFNHDHSFRRKNIAEVFFFDEKLKIGELQWQI